jgi:hypothetical protein
LFSFGLRKLKTSTNQRGRTKASSGTWVNTFCKENHQSETKEVVVKCILEIEGNWRKRVKNNTLSCQND